MNRLPTKQIYLLSVIIVGIIALSVYSTYALFTFEGSTSDIVAIHTPKSLIISENIYEYQQLIVDPNTVTTTEIDIYNNFEYDVCYSVWYKIIGDLETKNKIQIFEQTGDNLSTSGVLSSYNSAHIKIVVINDNDTETKINIGTIGASKNAESCSLNLADDKQVISSSYENINILTTKILEEKEQINEIDEGYLTYQNITDVITFKDTDKIFISTEFTYKNEMFTLTNPVEITLQDFVDKYSLSINDTYFCLTNKECKILYNINNIEKEVIELENSSNETEEIINYKITIYDKLIGYSKGTNGLRLVNEKDYIYYGDNPNNFIYYNCENNDNLDTCELWRIVGFFYDEETDKYITKIIRNESIGKYQFDYKLNNDINESSNVWKNATLNKYLNEEYKLINNYDIYTYTYIQPVERISILDTDIKNIQIKDENNDSKISLLNLSDYLHASNCEKNKINEYTGECLTNNWLNNVEILEEWTLTSKEVSEITLPIETPEDNIVEVPENETNEEVVEDVTETPEDTDEAVEENNYVINYVYSIGENITENDVNKLLEVRPVLFLKSRIVLLDGNGSLERPYIVK